MMTNAHADTRRKCWTGQSPPHYSSCASRSHAGIDNYCILYYNIRSTMHLAQKNELYYARHTRTLSLPLQFVDACRPPEGLAAHASRAAVVSTSRAVPASRPRRRTRAGNCPHGAPPISCYKRAAPGPYSRHQQRTTTAPDNTHLVLLASSAADVSGRVQARPPCIGELASLLVRRRWRPVRRAGRSWTARPARARPSPPAGPAARASRPRST